MTGRPLRRRTLALAALVAGAGAAPGAAAVEVTRLETNAAVSACRAALPTYQHALRFRPLSVQNESATTAFVTCALENESLANRNTPAVGVIMRNDSAVDVEFECVVIDSSSLVAGPYWRFSRLALPAHSAGVEFEFRVNAEPPYTMRTTAMSCSLPPGTGIAAVWREFQEDVGD